MKTILALAVALSMAVLAPCTAKENYHEKQVNADTKEAFADISQNVRREMDHGGKYEFVPPDERVKIDKSFGEMNALFDQYGSVSAMNQDAKVKLFNDQEVVNSILTRRDKDRVICEDKPKLGSHVRSTNCHTYGQQEDARRGSKEQMDEWTRRGCSVAGCVGSSAPRPQVSSGGGP